MPKPPSGVTPPAVPPPAPPSLLSSERTLAVLRRLHEQRKVIDQRIHSVAQTIFKPGTEIKYLLGSRNYYGRVVEVIGNPGETQVRVVNVVTGKKRSLRLVEIVGIVQEA